MRGLLRPFKGIFLSMGKLEMLNLIVLISLVLHIQLTACQDTAAKVKGEAASPNADFRLPNTLKPLHYYMILQPFVNGNHTIKGYIEITLEVVHPTSVITLHIKDILTNNDTVEVRKKEVENSTVQISKQNYDPKTDFYTAHLHTNLTQGELYVISMHYEGILQNNLRGFFYGEYDKNGVKRGFAATQFQPTHTRKAFPCFDEPAFRATFDVNIIREISMGSLSAMAKIDTHPVSDQPGWYMDTFMTSASMPSYLNAFVVSDLVSRTLRTNRNTSFSVWARDAVIGHSAYPLQKGKEMLHYFEDYFQIPYPFVKLDSVALPEFGGGMENWGLILYREPFLLYDPSSTSASEKQLIGEFIAHELAHMWFGNLVTPLWWSDLWLSEGFASHVETAGLNAVEPDFKMEDQFASSTLQSALKLDALASSHQISINVGHPDEISDIFDAITYSKGSSILRMLEAFLTESTFRKGVTNYLNAFSYSNAKQDDLWNYMTQQARLDKVLPEGVTVKEIMDSWTLKMGYPVISVKRYANGTALVTQQRFLSQIPGNYTDTIDYSWWVPLTSTSKANPNFEKSKPKQWMKPSEKEILIGGMPSNAHWVLFNTRYTGYYRVNYEESNWNKLIAQLKENHKVIHPLNRIQLISDSFCLAKGDLLSYKIPLEISNYLVKEREYAPLQTAFDALYDIARQFRGEKEFEGLKNFALSLVSTSYKEIGFIDSLSDPHLKQMTRISLLDFACYFGHKPCLEDSLKLFNQWMDDPTNDGLISPNVRKPVLCYAIQEGGEEQWNFALKRYLESNSVSEASLIITVLGCTRNITLKEKYMKMAFNQTSGIKTHDVRSALSHIGRDKEGDNLIWNYITNNFQHVLQHFDTVKRVAALIKSSSNFFNTPQELAMVEKFRKAHSELQGPGTRNIDNAIEEIKGRIHFREKNYLVITQWLINNKYVKQV